MLVGNGSINNALTCLIWAYFLPIPSFGWGMRHSLQDFPIRSQSLFECFFIHLRTPKFKNFSNHGSSDITLSLLSFFTKSKRIWQYRCLNVALPLSVGKVALGSVVASILILLHLPLSVKVYFLVLIPYGMPEFFQTVSY